MCRKEAHSKSCTIRYSSWSIRPFCLHLIGSTPRVLLCLWLQRYVELDVIDGEMPVINDIRQSDEEKKMMNEVVPLL